MTTATSTQGFQLTLDSESALGTADSGIDKEIRVQEVPTAPTTTRSAQAQSNLGHENVFTKDAPIAFEEPRLDGLSFSVAVRTASGTGEIPPLITALKSAGCTTSAVPAAGDTDLSVYVSVTSFNTTASLIDATTDAYNVPLFIRLGADDGLYEPNLINFYDEVGGATENLCVAQMALSGAAAASNAVIRGYVAYPPYGNQVAATSTLTFDYKTRGQHAGQAGNDDLTFIYSASALSNVGEIEITPNGDVIFPLSFHIGDVEDTFADDMATDSMLDSSKQAKLDTNFRFTKADAAVGGTTAFGTDELISAKINLGIDCQPIPGHGSTSCVNGIQGYFGTCIDPSITVELLLTSAQLLAFESATTNQQLGFIQPVTALTDVAWGFWAPNCQLRESVSVDFSEKFHKMTAVYDMCAPVFTGASTANGTDGQAPWVFAIMSTSA